MRQFAQQAEARELRALLISIDEKLDDVRRAQRDDVLAQMEGAAAEIEEAVTLREHGGDPRTLWEKVSGASGAIKKVQNNALLALGALADKVEGKRRTGELRKVAQEIERDVAVQLAILGRCFELQDEFRVVELDHVLATAPEILEGHRRGLAAVREKRRAGVLKTTTRLMAQMDAAGAIANENVLLQARVARSVMDSLNSTAEIIDDFHAPLGIESDRDILSATPWREALRDPKQRRAATTDSPAKKQERKAPAGSQGPFVSRRTSLGSERPPERNEGTERSSRHSGVGQDAEPAEFLTAAVAVAASRTSATSRCTSGWSCEMAVSKLSSKRVRQFHGSTLSSTCA